MFATDHAVSPVISTSLYSKTDVVEEDVPNPVVHNNPQDLWMASLDIMFPSSAAADVKRKVG